MSEAVLVVGAGGTVGRAVVRTLLAGGAPALAIVRSDAAARALAPFGVPLRWADLDDPATVGRALDGVRCVFVVTKPTPRQPQLEAALAEVLALARVQRVVRLSVIAAQADAASAVRAWHGQSEDAYRIAGVPTVHLRANFFMQNLLTMRASIAAKGRLSLPLGAARVAAVDVEDIAQAAARLLTGAAPFVRGDVFELSGPEALDGPALAAGIAQHWGLACSYRDLDLPKFEAAMLAQGAAPWLASALARLYVDMQAGLNERVADLPPALLGRPPTRLDEFLRRTASTAHAPTVPPGAPRAQSANG